MRFIRCKKSVGLRGQSWFISQQVTVPSSRAAAAALVPVLRSRCDAFFPVETRKGTRSENVSPTTESTRRTRIDGIPILNCSKKSYCSNSRRPVRSAKYG